MYVILVIIPAWCLIGVIYDCLGEDNVEEDIYAQSYRLGRVARGEILII